MISTKEIFLMELVAFGAIVLGVWGLNLENKCEGRKVMKQIGGIIYFIISWSGVIAGLMLY